MNEPAPDTGYNLEVLAEVTGVSARTILEYQECGLICPRFDDETVRLIRRIEHVRETCGMNLAGLRLMSRLLEEVEQLRAEMRLRQR